MILALLYSGCFKCPLCPHNPVHQPPGFEKMKPGRSRPIPKGDLKTIESQLARHQLNEQRAKAKRQQREDPFHANPWDNSFGRHETSALVDSTISTNEEFYTLDLAHSYAGSISTQMTQSVTQMEDSFISTASHVSSQDTYSSYGRAPPSTTGRSERSVTPGGGGGAHIYGRNMAGDLESIPLHEGVGLQQLSQSPPLPSSARHHHASRDSAHQYHAHGSPGSVHVQSSGRHVVLGSADSLLTQQRGRMGVDGGSILSVQSESGGAGSRQSSTHRKQQHYADSQFDLCKYSFTISGITVALLEADPMHTHTTPAASDSPLLQRGSPPSSRTKLDSSSRPDFAESLSSVDEGGLDPVKYFDTVSALLEEGVSRKLLQRKQEELSQVLPNDHLL